MRPTAAKKFGFDADPEKPEGLPEMGALRVFWN